MPFRTNVSDNPDRIFGLRDSTEVKMWDTATGQQLLTFKGHIALVRGLQPRWEALGLGVWTRQ
jgi:hypothetical protein